MIGVKRPAVAPKWPMNPSVETIDGSAIATGSASPSQDRKARASPASTSAKVRAPNIPLSAPTMACTSESRTGAPITIGDRSA